MNSYPHLTPSVRLGLLLAVAGAVEGSPTQAASVIGLGGLPAAAVDSRAFALSSNGLFAAGSAADATGSEPFRWNSGLGMIGLGNFPGATSGEAEAISSDGSVVAGFSGTDAFRWTTATGLSSLGHLTPGASATAYGISSDGSVIVGVDGSKAFRWAGNAGMTALTPLAPSDVAGAIAVSGNGQNVAGTSGGQAVRWLSGVPTGLGDLPGGSVHSEGYAVSGEGNAVAGYSQSSNGFEAFRWVEGVGMAGLGDLAGGDFFSIAYGITPNGQTVVGVGDAGNALDAFIWTPGGGIQALWDVLSAQGADLSHWLNLDTAMAISPDGRFIGGQGLNFNGEVEAYIAEITPLPVPTPTPFGGTARTLPGRVQAEDFDAGGQLIGYFDTTGGNSGGAYRAADHVDIQTTTDTGGGYNVTAFSAREWLDYSVNVTASGGYVLRLRTARTGAAATTVRVLAGNSNDQLAPLAADISIPATNPTQPWVNVEVRDVSFTAGAQLLRVQCLAGTFSLNWIEVVPAGIAREVWTGVSGTSVSQIPVTQPPNLTGVLPTIEAPINWADRYGTRLRGYIKAPTTGNYRFWIASDDNSELWLGTSANPSSKRRIANVNGWTNSRQWNKYNSQKSAAISLTAGQTYYVEVLQKEDSGGDNVAVGWAKPGQGSSAPSEIVPNSVLTPFYP